MSQIDFPKIYNPASQTPQELIENFVVRTELFHDIFNDIKNSDMKNPQQHYIIQGIRGQGKTTLLLRIAYEIDRDKALRKYLLPVIFNEEQYNVNKLFKLWETIAEYLDEMGEITGLYNEMQKFSRLDDFEERCFQILETALKKYHKKMILFIDNIDEILLKFSKREHQRLREVLQESAELRIIGASSVSLEFHFDYGKPCYQFFHMPQLRGLNTKDTKTLLLKLGEYYKTERVREIVENQPGRIEALRRLTGGVIRTIILLYKIFVDDRKGNAFMDLEKILDSVTPLYKHRMDILSSQQQAIVDFIAISWDAVSTKEIARKTKMESKAVSSQLKQLGKYHIIEKQDTGTKNHLYRISERFFNIWYLMRQSRKWDTKRVRFLVEFLQIWCDENDLVLRARRHLEAIKRGRLCDKHALLMTEALARTPLKRELQHELVAETRDFLDKGKSELKDYLCSSDYELSEDSEKALKAGDIEEAIREIEQIRNKNAKEYNFLGILILIYKKDIDRARRYLLMAVEKEDAGAMNNLALLYNNEYKDFKKAEKYYLMAVEKEDANAMNNLAQLYVNEFKDFKNAEKYYLMAVEKEHAGAMNNLAWFYFEQKTNKQKALDCAGRSYKKEQNLYSSHTYSTVLLWNNQIEKAFKISQKFFAQPEAYEKFPDDIHLFLLLLIAKHQYHLVYKLFQQNQHNLKDRFKPVYYSLMYFMQDEYPNEYRKMGGELKQTVEEIIKKIQQLEQDYR
ncbi:hypothetical protein JW935_13810 [candidate division KSB1 bacterium]|nr:hypothetical protein [candidate division KSB1 bacterium]